MRGAETNRPGWWDTAARAVQGRGRWVAAVSGGSDSVALLRFLKETVGGRIVVAHLHHGTRGAESDADARFVQELSETLGLTCVVGHWRPLRESHFEADARQARLDWLKAVATEHEAGLVALGHTKDDQAETVLHRIVRGTGLRGLAGIRSRRELAKGIALVRPLLGVSRGELRSYLESLGQAYREDLSNADTSRTRSRIRHDLLPRLAADYNPEVIDAIVRLASQAGEVLEGRIARLDDVVFEVGSDGFGVSLESLRALERPDRIAFFQGRWRERGWPEREMNADRWRRLADWVEHNAPRFDLSGGISVGRHREFMVIRRPPADTLAVPEPEPVPLPVPGRVRFGEIVLEASEGQGQETIDHDTIMGPLFVRTMISGDWFDPLGLDGRTQTLHDFLRNRGIPREERRHVPLVCDDRGILWVVGHRIAHRARLTETTVRELGLQASRD